MSSIPSDLLTLLRSTFHCINDRKIADELCTFGTQLYEIVYTKHLHERTPADNRPEHELVVLRNAMRICWRSGRERDSGHRFDIHELRVAVATSLLHDLRFVPRVMEEDIEAAIKRGDTKEAARLKKKKSENRLLHMQGSAEDALEVIEAIPSLMSEQESRQCIGYISLHDTWKTGLPYPASSDWLAVCCFEGDALWPLDIDFGPLADLERSWFLKHKNLDDFQTSLPRLKKRAQLNLNGQLHHYRKSSFGSVVDVFQDNQSVIRTGEGARILDELCKHWGLS